MTTTTENIITTVSSILLVWWLTLMLTYWLASIKNSFNQRNFEIANYKATHETVKRSYWIAYNDISKVKTSKQNAMNSIKQEVKRLENKGYTCWSITKTLFTEYKSTCYNKNLSLNKN